jgi:hypothetical protein
MAGGDSEKEAAFREKVQVLLEVFDLIDAAFKFAMASDQRSKWLFERRDEIKRLLQQMGDSQPNA